MKVGQHEQVWEYDGAFGCVDCGAKWGALPGNPEMSAECHKPAQAAPDAAIVYATDYRYHISIHEHLRRAHLAGQAEGAKLARAEWEVERAELLAGRRSHGPYKLLGTDGCEDCATGRTETYYLERKCLTCRLAHDQ